MKEKKPEKNKKPVGDIFGDDDSDIFSDMASLETKKKLDDKPKKSSVEPAKKVKPIANKTSIQYI